MDGAEAHEAQVAKCEDDLGQRSKYASKIGVASLYMYLLALD